MKIETAFLVLNQIDIKEKNTRSIEAVFFSKKNAQMFARQLMEQYRPYKMEAFFSIRKFMHHTTHDINWK